MVRITKSVILEHFGGGENWKSVTCWRVLFIRSQSVVDVILMRNNWKLRIFSCLLLYLNVDMIKAKKGSFSGAPTPPMHTLILKGLELHAQAFFINASSKSTLKHTSILSPDPHFCECAWGGVGANERLPFLTLIISTFKYNKKQNNYAISNRYASRQHRQPTDCG